MTARVASGARGFNRGEIYTREGKLVASVVQEGLMRLKTKKRGELTPTPSPRSRP